MHHAARYLKRLRDDPEYCRQKAEAGQKYIREHMSVEACAEKIRKRMNEIIHC